MLKCQSTLDVCVFVITCKELGDIIARLFRRGVKVRIITDDEQLEASGSQIWSLIRDGIPVRTNKTSYLMHHKFAIVDGNLLINGSFNWTKQAITGNQENLIITDNEAITTHFVNEFQRLWTLYDPLKRLGSSSTSRRSGTDFDVKDI
ncbi:mitochondrial cardiolipin hydrolase-like [Plakobranchus ocellatus]|uniref:Mitochondrial cardiolipin hydrolase n=1 Tax=Plakobranchus ocellatus TaxID=259542 RepID=A0AAV3Y7V9_9GAST|nr:mitochondrial cardiolipin hydrolase-like [Plakobranchus ocellatus]